jgi:hypothetical protein
MMTQIAKRKKQIVLLTILIVCLSAITLIYAITTISPKELTSKGETVVSSRVGVDGNRLVDEDNNTPTLGGVSIAIRIVLTIMITISQKVCSPNYQIGKLTSESPVSSRMVAS